MFFFFSMCNFSVMTIDKLTFNVFLFKKYIVFVLFKGMFLYSCSTVLDAFIIWWVKPHYFPFSLQFTSVFSKTIDFGSITFLDIQILDFVSWYSSFTNSNFCLSDEFLQSNLHNDISNLFRVSDG